MGSPVATRPVDDRARSRPTLEQVAAQAGVSRATVSRVVTGSTPVSAPVRAAVTRAISELGYVPNLAARSLVTSRADSVALVVTEDQSKLFGDPYFAGVVRGVAAGLAESDLQLVLMMERSHADHERLERFLASRRIDGVMVISLHGDDPLPERVERLGIPVVMLGQPLKGAWRRYVDVDNRGGGREAVEHLLARGRRRIAMITGPLDMRVALDRLAGYGDALRAAGVPERGALIAHGDHTEPGGRRAMEALLEGAGDLDAVFVASDMMAVGALSALHSAGRRVPDEVAVVGFDDQPNAAHTLPPLTTVHQPIERMGGELARLLIDVLRDPGLEHGLVLPSHLVVRESS
jgi:DNA-binding LacI/PurR family transcriptional regulator